MLIRFAMAAVLGAIPAGLIAQAVNHSVGSAMQSGLVHYVVIWLRK